MGELPVRGQRRVRPGHGLAQNAVRGRLAELTEKLIASNANAALKEAAQKWLDTMNDRAANDQPSKDYIAALEQGVATIDELTAFVNSDKAKEIFGDKLGDMQAHAASWRLPAPSTAIARPASWPWKS